MLDEFGQVGGVKSGCAGADYLRVIGDNGGMKRLEKIRVRRCHAALPLSGPGGRYQGSSGFAAGSRMACHFSRNLRYRPRASSTWFSSGVSLDLTSTIRPLPSTSLLASGWQITLSL